MLSINFCFIKLLLQFCSKITCLIYSTLYLKGFPWGSASKESAYSAGDLGSIPGLGRSTGEGKG